MAKVKSFSSFNVYNFPRNDASGSLSLESPPKYELICLNEADKKPDKQHFDKDFVKTIEINDGTPVSFNLVSNTDNAISILDVLEAADAGKNDYPCLKFENPVSMAPITSCETTVGSEISLSALAENHFKSDKKFEALEDTCISSDFTLDDLLSDVNETPISSTCDGLDFLGLSFSPNDSGRGNNFRTESTDEVINEDLSFLLNSGPTNFLQTSNFPCLDGLANNHVLSNLDCDLNNFGPTKFPQSPNFVCLADLANAHILNDLDSEFISNSSVGVNCCQNSWISESELSVSLDCLLSTGNTESNNLSLDFGLSRNLGTNTVVYDDFGKCDANAETLIDDLTDDEGIPDIDLNVCIKKTRRNHSSSVTSTSPASDSGFDEPDFAFPKCKPFVAKYSLSENGFYTERNESALSNPKPSLFSKAISCKQKSDKMRIEKLKSIKRELFLKHFPTAFVDCSRQQHPLSLDCFEDKSNHRIINTNGRFMVSN